MLERGFLAMLEHGVLAMLDGAGFGGLVRSCLRSRIARIRPSAVSATGQLGSARCRKMIPSRIGLALRSSMTQ
jgi:hypothetical protein